MNCDREFKSESHPLFSCKRVARVWEMILPHFLRRMDTSQSALYGLVAENFDEMIFSFTFWDYLLGSLGGISEQGKSGHAFVGVSRRSLGGSLQYLVG